MFSWIKSVLKEWNDKRIRTKGGKIVMGALMYDIIHTGTREAKETVIHGNDGDTFEHKGKIYTVKHGKNTMIHT